MKREIKRSMQSRNKRIRLKNHTSRLRNVKGIEYHRANSRKDSRRKRVGQNYRILL